MNKKVIKYFIITFVWAWILWLPFVLPYFGVYEMTETLQGLIMPAIMLGAFGPLASAVILTYKDGGFKAVKAFFKRCLDFKIKPKYYIIALVLGVGLTALAYYIITFTGLDVLQDNLFPEELNIPVYLLIVPYALMILFVGGGQEEFGWRGYAQDPMQDKLGIIKGSLILGLLWGLWHGPLWLIEGEGHQYYSFLAFLIYTTSWSLIISIIYNISGKKVVIAWFMHTIANVSVPFFPILFLEDVPQPGYWVWAGCNVLAAIGIAIWFTRKQKREQLSYE
ncbi:CAAX amino terminal protease self- immunity [Candidatus Izimaplasma bacterium HR1]|jgi:membrane protease YdiL (CAAX protease family)|uniref:CPBP family glutamic-type intramembrane protease n=1 Tax=Candidatus Izimoplasma sp. HR1 TaxID=1541959 RepID=UPI0004F88600|nr:CAAX amino terminal protease self- immunity [Candidatus Izimaplasma bacterium HR1]